MGRRRKTNLHLPPKMQLKHGTYYLTPYVDGKLQWIRLGRDYASALTRYAELIAPTKVGETFNEVADRFESECMSRYAVSRYAANSQRSFRSWLKPLRAVFGPVPIADIKQMHAARFLDESPHKTSANRQISLLSVMLGEAVRWGWLKSNPLLHMRKNKESRRTRYITDEELKRLIDAADFQMACMIRIAYLTALRKSDIIAIQWRDLKDGNLYVAQKKTKTPIAYSLEGELGQVFADLHSKRKVLSPNVFLNKRHTPICDRTVDTYWWAVRDKAGLPDVVFHDLRRKRLTDLTASHGEEFAQKVAGHLDRKSTARYNTPDMVVVELPP